MEVSPVNNIDTLLDLTHIQNGVYVLKIGDQYSVTTRKVVKM